MGSQCRIIWGNKTAGDQSRVNYFLSILKEIVEISWLILVQCSKNCEMIVTFSAVSLFLNYNACNAIQLLYDFEIIIPLSAAVEPLYSLYVYVLSYNYVPFICFLIFNFLY